MRGRTRSFPPMQAFAYWFPDTSKFMQSNLAVFEKSRLGKKVTLQKRAICRMCGKSMKQGEHAIIDGYSFEYAEGWVSGFIHSVKCIPLIEFVLGDQEENFEERERIRSDDFYGEEEIQSHSLEEAREEAEYLLNTVCSGKFELCYLELDGVRHPEPIYSETHKRTVVKV